MAKIIKRVHIHNMKPNISDISEFIDNLPLEQTFSKGDSVILKPNFVAPRDNQTGATTNLNLLEAISNRVKQIGAQPVLIEMPGMEFTIKQVYDYLNIFDLCKKINLPVFIPEEKDYVNLEIKRGKCLKSLRIPKIVLESKILSIPIMKTHVITQVTLGIKNLMGLLHNDTRREMHIKGIHNSLIDMYSVLKPDYTILDAIYSMQGDGAVYGDVKQTKMIMASKYTDSLDRIATQFMDIDYKNVPYLAGIIKDEDIEIIGDFKTNTFRLPVKNNAYHIFYRSLYIVDLLFERIFKQHFNSFLYRSGLAGTRPKIEIDEKCVSCKKCIAICSVNAISDDLKIDRKKCLRCLRCYEICPHSNIKVKGLSKPSTEMINEK